MNYKDKIIKIAEDNNSYVQTKIVTENGIPKNYLKELVNENRLLKVSRGLYMLPDCFIYEYFIFQSTNNDSIFFISNSSLFT